MAQSAPILSRYRPAPRTRRRTGSLLAWLLSWLLGLTLFVGLVGWRYDVAYTGRIFEGVSANGVALGGLTPAQATAALEARPPSINSERLVLRVAGESWVATMTDLGIHLDATTMAHEAYLRGRTGSVVQQWLDRFVLWHGASDERQVQPAYRRDLVAVDALLTRIANEVARDPQDARLHVQGLSVSSMPAQPGRQLDIEASRQRLVQATDAGERAIDLVLTERVPHIIGAEEAAAKARELLTSPLLLYFEQPEFHLDDTGYVATTERRQWTVDRERLSEMLFLLSEPLESGQYAWNVRLKPELLREEIEQLANEINREPRDARFDYDPDTGVLTPLVVSQDGLRVDVDASLSAVEQALSEGVHEVQLSVTTVPPRVVTSDASKFNISGVAARGFSNYTGSAYERIVNVGVAASMFHGIVIPPGGEFSFNEHLGWVVDATGYEEGYIISGNRTEVDVGGGVCQVSTTAFRAAIDAGFEITERHPHAYRVPYYENGSPLGFDATVFSPWVDLKFRNNTENYYLMEVENNPDANTLAINLYGPSTGREVEVLSTTVETIPHGPPIYETDPALPPGTVKQVYWSHPCATIKLERIIRDTNGNEIGRDVFWSDYKPWQARYLLGPGG